MKQIVIDGKTYSLEYGTEASFCSECLKELTSLLGNIALAEERNDVKQILSSLADIPRASVALLYAGLIKHHGTGRNGDGTVPNIEAAKELAIQYIEEDAQTFAGLMAMSINQMSEDGFFRRLGLDSMIGTPIEKEKKEIGISLN